MALTRCLTGLKTKQICTVLGSQWGDEGKGKQVDILAKDYDIIARFNGGANAGHTLKTGNLKFAFHLLPCGMLYENKMNILGNGCVLNIPQLFEEINDLEKHNIEWKHKFMISTRAHLTFQAQLQLDGMSEKKRFLGTTKRGIGPTYSNKCMRYGLRVGDLLNWDTFVQKFNGYYDVHHSLYPSQRVDTEAELATQKPLRDILVEAGCIQDTIPIINEALQNGKRVLAEGANALMLDVDFGTYPYVTSSSTMAGGICTGMGVSPDKIETVVGVCKAYTTRVGEGPFPSLIEGQMEQRLREIGGEFGATTGRPRLCGWLDLNLIKYGKWLNNYSSLNLTKLDCLSNLGDLDVVVSYEIDGKTLKGLPSDIDEWYKIKTKKVTLKGWTEDIADMRDYNQLPLAARDYVEFIEKETGIGVSWIGVGPDREGMIFKQP